MEESTVESEGQQGEARELCCDIVVVGAGCAGIFAACHAAQEGASVVLVEAGEHGVGVRSSALAAVNSSYQHAQGVNINEKALLEDIVRYSSGYCRTELWQQWIDHSAEAVEWYADLIKPHGYDLILEHSMPADTNYHVWPTGHGTALVDSPEKRIKEADVTDILIDHFRSQGGNFMNNTRMQALVCEDGRVAGVDCEGAQGPVRIMAGKGVIVATGGYANNPEMYTARQQDIIRGVVGHLNFRVNKGEGISACVGAGALMSPLAGSMIFDRGAVKPGEPLGDIFDKPFCKHVTFSTQPFLKVNRQGRRFVNESQPYDFVLHAAGNFEDPTWYVVWDSTWKDDVLRFHTVGCSSLAFYEGGNNRPQGLEDVAGQMEALVESGYMVKADTLRELGEALCLEDVDLFLAQVARYNENAEIGCDRDFGKEPFRLSTLDTPPYYGMRVGGEVLCTLDGVMVNEDYQVLDASRQPIAGLYAVGNDAGGYFAHTYPNFSAGLCAGRAVTSGMLCGRALARK